MICASMFTLLYKTKGVGKRIFYLHVYEKQFSTEFKKKISVHAMIGNLRQWVKAVSRGRVLESALEKRPCENIFSLTLRMVFKSW